MESIFNPTLNGEHKTKWSTRHQQREEDDKRENRTVISERCSNTQKLSERDVNHIIKKQKQTHTKKPQTTTLAVLQDRLSEKKMPTVNLKGTGPITGYFLHLVRMSEQKL